jgi:hypothetical protein
MTLTIELPPELERVLAEEATRRGQEAEDVVRSLLEERLVVQRQERARRIAALMDQWDAEDAANSDPDPPPSIPPVVFREVRIE